MNSFEPAPPSRASDGYDGPACYVLGGRFGHVAHGPVSGLAIAALVCAVTGMAFFAIPLGIRARRDISRSDGRLGGRGLATAAIWISVVFVVAFIALSLLSVAAVTWLPGVHEITPSGVSCVPTSTDPFCP